MKPMFLPCLSKGDAKKTPNKIHEMHRKCTENNLAVSRNILANHRKGWFSTCLKYPEKNSCKDNGEKSVSEIVLFAYNRNKIHSVSKKT